MQHLFALKPDNDSSSSNLDPGLWHTCPTCYSSFAEKMHWKKFQM